MYSLKFDFILNTKIKYLTHFLLPPQVIDPDDLPKRARWTIIATAFLLLIMCLFLVGITLRMAPIIDDMGKFYSGVYGKTRAISLARELSAASLKLSVAINSLWIELRESEWELGSARDFSAFSRERWKCLLSSPGTTCCCAVPEWFNCCLCFGRMHFPLLGARERWEWVTERKASLEMRGKWVEFSGLSRVRLGGLENNLQWDVYSVGGWLVAGSGGILMVDGGFFSCENILCNQGRAVNLGAAGVVTIFYRHLWQNWNTKICNSI